MLTKDQLETFMKLIEGDEEWYDFFYTEIITGMRQGEICGLRWEDFDREKRTLRVARSMAGGLQEANPAPQYLRWIQQGYRQPHPAVSRCKTAHTTQNGRYSKALQPPPGVGTYEG